MESACLAKQILRLGHIILSEYKRNYSRRYIAATPATVTALVARIILEEHAFEVDTDVVVAVLVLVKAE